jgi:hypothetical protein
MQPGSHPSGVQNAVCGSRSQNKAWRQPGHREHYHRCETIYVGWIHILDITSPPVRGHDWSQRLGRPWESHKSLRCYGGASYWHPTKCPSRSDIVEMSKEHHRNHHLAAVYRPQLKARTQLRGKPLQKLCRNHWAPVPLGLCLATWGRGQCFSRGLRAGSETAPPHGRQQGSQWKS